MPSVGRPAVTGQQLEQAIADAVQAGLINRRVDDGALVLFTSRGRALAEGKVSPK